MSQVNLKVESFSGNELIVREGKALELKEPVILSLTGDLKNVNAYIAKHNQAKNDVNYVDPTKAVIIVNRQGMKIELRTDQSGPYSHTITGALSISDELKKFKINTEQVYTREEFVKLLRFNKMFFDEAESYTKVLESFQKLDLSTSGNVAAATDNRGNKDLQFKKTVTSNVPHSFSLNIPIFKGYENRKIMVEICVDVSESKAIFWLESTELNEAIQNDVIKLIEEEVKDLKGTYVVLYQ